MRFSVKVKMGGDFLEIDDSQIVVGIKSKPKEGKANAEIIKKIAKHFHKHASSVRIVLGKTSRNKVIEVKD